MFLYKEAAKAYKEGYRLCEESDVLKAYLYCCMKSKSPEEYVKMLSGNSSFLSMDAILKEELKKSIKDEDLDTITRADVRDELLKIAYDNYNEQCAIFDEQMPELERVIMLRVVDTLWMDHLDEMEQIKREIGLRAYGQHDPVVEYRNVGSDLYEGLLYAIKRDTVKYILNAKPRVKIEREQVAKPMDTGGDGTLKSTGKKAENTPGRNDLCPCGSGKKYKHCCGK
jgi:preprotein translocase subunit SecA